MNYFLITILIGSVSFVPYFVFKSFFHTFSILNISFYVKLTRLPHLIDNFDKLSFFYKKEMTHKENIPVKLISTNIINHKTAIIGLISKYKPSYIKFFFDTLACTGYNDTLILLYSYIDNITKDYIISFSSFFEVIMIPSSFSFTKSQIGTIEYYKNNQMLKNTKIDSFEKIDLIELPFVQGDYRFEIEYFLYKNHFFDEYDLLFLTDIGDVLFQGDIRLFNYSEGVYVVEEAFVSIKNSNYWLKMYNLSYKSFEDRSELCVGTVILVGPKGFSFLTDLHNQLKDHLNQIIQRPNFQGTLNYLVYNNTYNYPDGYVKFITTSYGIINSIGKINYHLIHFNSKDYFYNFYFKFHLWSIYDVYYHDQNFILYNQNLQKIAVIHHTKYLPIVKNKTYNGVLNLCHEKLPINYEYVMKSHRIFNI